MRQYSVTGMSCAACSTRVEKAVSAVDGVTSCSVSLLTNSMGVEGNADPETIIAAVREAGYDAGLKGTAKDSDKREAVSFSGEDGLIDREPPILKKRHCAIYTRICSGHLYITLSVSRLLQEYLLIHLDGSLIRCLRRQP